MNLVEDIYDYILVKDYIYYNNFSIDGSDYESIMEIEWQWSQGTGYTYKDVKQYVNNSNKTAYDVYTLDSNYLSEHNSKWLDAQYFTKSSTPVDGNCEDLLIRIDIKNGHCSD